MDDCIDNLEHREVNDILQIVKSLQVLAKKIKIKQKVKNADSLACY